MSEERADEDNQDERRCYVADYEADRGDEPCAECAAVRKLRGDKLFGREPSEPAVAAISPIFEENVNFLCDFLFICARIDQKVL